MNKVKIVIWGREFDLPVIEKKFKGKEITVTQKEAVDHIGECAELMDSVKKHVEKYILENGLKEDGIDKVDNIFKYVMPNSISVPRTKKRTVAVMCNYKYDLEHGIAIIFEDEKYKDVGPQDLIL